MKQISREKIEQIRHVWKTSGLKAECLAADLGVARSTLIRHTRDMSRRGQYDAEIRRLALEGLRPYQIAKQVPITREAIRRKLTKWGLKCSYSFAD